MNKIIIKIAIIMALVLLCQATVMIFKVPSYTFAPPIKVIETLINQREVLFKNSLITITEATAGFLLANLISVSIALVIYLNRKLSDIIIPFAIVINAMPIMAITPLLSIWFGSGIQSKIATVMLFCFFPSLVNVLRGIRSLDIEFLWLFKIYSANRSQVIKKLVFPSILPYLFSALKTSSSLAVVGALVGEFIGSNKGLGFIIMSSYYSMNISLAFAAITISSIFGILFYYLIHYFENKINFDKREV